MNWKQSNCSQNVKKKSTMQFLGVLLVYILTYAVIK